MAFNLDELIDVYVKWGRPALRLLPGWLEQTDDPEAAIERARERHGICAEVDRMNGKRPADDQWLCLKPADDHTDHFIALDPPGSSLQA